MLIIEGIIKSFAIGFIINGGMANTLAMPAVVPVAAATTWNQMK